MAKVQKAANERLRRDSVEANIDDTTRPLHKGHSGIEPTSAAAFDRADHQPRQARSELGAYPTDQGSPTQTKQ